MVALAGCGAGSGGATDLSSTQDAAFAGGDLGARDLAPATTPDMPSVDMADAPGPLPTGFPELPAPPKEERGSQVRPAGQSVSSLQPQKQMKSVPPNIVPHP